MDYTSSESVPERLFWYCINKTFRSTEKTIHFTKKAFDSTKWTLRSIGETFRSTKEEFEEDVYLSLASATNMLEARTTERLLHDERHVSALTTCPEGYARLHELCKACTLFTQRSVALSWLDSSKPHSDWPPRERYRLCTVAHLRRFNGECHFCTVLHFFVSRLLSPKKVEDSDKSWVYLKISRYREPWVYNSIRFDASLYPRHEFLGGFDLCPLADEGAGTHVDALARATCVPLRSNDNTECVRKWLEICLRDHTKCRTADHEAIALRTRPERMLAIDDDRVRLMCNWSKSSVSGYLALSHMWGTDSKQQLRLVLSRLDEFQEDIPWMELPFIFKEAIRIARQIGYNYIWIDSLCIIQDSANDWIQEASKMAHVYGHADCTISYLLPPQDVLSKPRNPKLWSPCIFRPPSLTLRGAYIRPNVDEDTSRSIDWLTQEDWPLLKRAWVCQEYLLSPRVVFVGHRNLMWECSESLCDELLGPIEKFPRATASKTLFSAVKSVTLPVTTIAAQLRFVEDWGRLVRHYRARVLTQPTDRIMAFAGIAEAVHNSTGMTYLAGCWAQAFPFSFTWSLVTPSSKNLMKEEAIDEAVPSWSWFSVPTLSANNFEFKVVKDLLEKLRQRTKVKRIYEAALLSFENGSQQAYADPSPIKAFHDFTEMNLNLAMKTWTGFLRDSKNSIEDQFGTLFWDEVNLEVKCQFDHLETKRDKVMTFGLLTELWEVNYERPFLVGLLMQLEPSGKAYKRIGLWTLYPSRYPRGWFAGRYNSASVFDQLEGVRSEHIRLV